MTDKFICKHPWTHFEVNNPNGDVTMCCDNNTLLGNVNEASIEEIWNGEKFLAIRKRMRDEGAHAMCPKSCPVLNGFKSYQSLDWYGNIRENVVARNNATKNEEEYEAGNLLLDSKPRWMRFAYSYSCNLDCYHCYQREDAIHNTKLPNQFIEQVHDLAAYYQVIYFFGGEPFLYKPITKMMEDINVGPDCRYHFVTNGTLLTERSYAMLSEKNIGHFAISLDAATEKSFNILRRRGANTSWDSVILNVGRIAKLKATKNFTFSISLTLNSINYSEIEQFVDLGIKYDAEPIILLVANPYETMEFQKTYLQFTKEQFETMFGQIDRSLEKVHSIGFQEAEKALITLKKVLMDHQLIENKALLFIVLNYLRIVYNKLPVVFQRPIRRYLYLPFRSLISFSITD